MLWICSLSLLRRYSTVMWGVRKLNQAQNLMLLFILLVGPRFAIVTKVQRSKFHTSQVVKGCTKALQYSLSLYCSPQRVTYQATEEHHVQVLIPLCAAHRGFQRLPTEAVFPFPWSGYRTQLHNIYHINRTGRENHLSSLQVCGFLCKSPVVDHSTDLASIER